jgi:polyhydroxyalkanoate synthesis regulator phasin
MEKQINMMAKSAMELLNKISELSESGDLDMFHESDCAKLRSKVNVLTRRIKKLNAGK